MSKLAKRSDVVESLKKHNMKQFSFALLINIPESMLSLWLRRKKALSSEKREEITQALAFMDAEASGYAIPPDFSNIEAVRPRFEEFRRSAA